LILVEPVIDTTFLPDLIVRAGNKINYTVPIEAAPRPTVKWSVNESPIDSGSRVDIQIYNSQVIFEIPFSVRNDTGRYTLTLENNLGKCSASAHVTVLGKINIAFQYIQKMLILIYDFFNNQLMCIYLCRSSITS